MKKLILFIAAVLTSSVKGQEVDTAVVYNSVQSATKGIVRCVGKGWYVKQKLEINYTIDQPIEPPENTSYYERDYIGKFEAVPMIKIIVVYRLPAISTKDIIKQLYNEYKRDCKNDSIADTSKKTSVILLKTTSWTQYPH